MNRLVGIACAIAMSFGVGACKDQVACEEGRFKVERTWNNVKNTAARRKIPALYEELSETQRQNRLTQWTPIEKEAETLRSSFETPQITWNAAAKSRAELTAKFKQVAPDGSQGYVGFARELERANRETDEFEHTCR